MRKAVVSPGAVVKANNDLITLANSIGRTVNGNKCATGASAGQFVVLLNSTISGRTDGLYTASKAIPANTAIDSSYLTSASEGGLNVLNSKLTYTVTLLASLTSSDTEAALPSGYTNYDALVICIGEGTNVFASNIFIKGMAFGRPHCQYMWDVDKLISVEIGSAKLKWHLAVPSGTSPNAKVYGITLFG